MGNQQSNDLDKQHVEDIFQRATEFYKNEKFDEAIGQCDRILNSIIDLRALNLKGDALLALNNPKEAIDCFDEVELNDKFYIGPYEWNSKGNAALEHGDHNNALAFYRKAILMDPDFAWSWRNIGFVQHENREYEEALVSYNRALRVAPENTTFLNDIGNVYFAIGNTKEALKYYDRAISLDPNIVQFWVNKCLSHYLLGEYEKALESSDRATQVGPEFIDGWETRGDILFDAGEYTSALEAYEKVVQLNPNSFYAWANQALVLSCMSRRDDADAYYRKALSLVEKELENYPYVPELFAFKGTCLRYIGDYKYAEECFQMALTLDPKNIEAIAGIIVIKSDFNFDHTIALQISKQWLELDPDSIAARINYVEVLLKNLLCEDALREIDKLLIRPLNDFDECLLKFFRLCSCVLLDNDRIDKELIILVNALKSKSKPIIFSENRWYFRGLTQVVQLKAPRDSGKFILLTILDVLQGKVDLIRLQFFQPE